MEDKVIGIIGLGYVGLPVAIEFGKKFETYGYDIDNKKISNYKKGIDETKQHNVKDFKKARFLNFTSDPSCLKSCNYIIVCVPTPINKRKQPDLQPLKSSCITCAKNLTNETIIIFESTVYPGLTEDFCVPLIENYSKLKWKKDFFVGYSPERINPNDKKHTIRKISKVVSGDSKFSLNKIYNLYKNIIDADVFKARNIKVAEAAKVIENTQRDINIALMNELSKIFDKLNISTKDVIDAASTKWNFNSYTPGLVGGHCIGVDPYYLTALAKKIDYNPEVILSGRKINDGMPLYIFKKIKAYANKIQLNKKLKILFLGLTFKEDCPDVRNSKSIELMELIRDKIKCDLYLHDPLVNLNSLNLGKAYKIKNLNKLNEFSFDLLIITVPHMEYLKIKKDVFLNILNKPSLIIDVKSKFKKLSNFNDIDYWSL